jgi:asparagine synthase (glutamine-hydrolysing)
MCGINGGWTNIAISRAAVEESLNVMRHRGPDDSGVFQDAPVFLGNRRLSIIDLEGGRQPIYNEDGSIAVVCNGEIYNYLELTSSLQSKGHLFKTRSDTEVIVHLYEEYGERLCEYLRGMFALSLWDSRKRLLFVARDRFGKKPLYYTQVSPGGLLFASEIKSLRSLAGELGETWSISHQAIYDYLSLCIVPQPYTIYNEVFALPASSWLRFDGSNLEIERYWELQYLPKIQMPYSEVVTRTRNLISEAVRLRLRSDVPVGIFLSGGVDSSVVAYEASRVLGDSLQTFTVAMEEEKYDESSVAARTAGVLGVQHAILPLEVTPLEELQRLVLQYDQPYADSSAIPSMKIARLARNHVTVILNGDGGDELFAGYKRHLAARLSDSFHWLPTRVAQVAARLLALGANDRRSSAGLLARYFRALACKDGERYLVFLTDMLRESDKRKVWRGMPMRSTEDWIHSILPKGLSGLDTQMCADIKINLVSDLLVKMDIATMAASLEGRSPFMDHVLAEFAASLPDSYRLHRMQTKALLKDAYKELLPGEVLGATKRGFEIPLVSWLRKDFQPILMDTLGNSAARVRSYVRGPFIDRLLQGKVMQDRNWAYLLYSLLVLELWLGEFD